MNTPRETWLAGCSAPLAVFVYLAFTTTAHANCFGPRQNEVICGDKRICVSGQASAAEGFYDRNTCVPTAPVCATLSHLADVYSGGNKATRPTNGKFVEIASAERLASVSPAICRKLGIPTSASEAPPGTPRPPGGSWCRSNAQRGGAPRSTHKSCLAMDIYVPGMPSSDRASRQKLANELYKSQKRGINVYPTGRAHVARSNEYFYSSGGVYPQSGEAPRKRAKRRHR